MDQMTPEEMKQKIDELLDEEYFVPIAVTRNGEPRLVVLPMVAYRSMHRGSRKVLRVEDMSEQDIEEIANAKMPEGVEHLDKESKGD